MKSNKNLFLDDKRMPSDAYLENLWDNPHEIYITEEWEIVENGIEFKEWIKSNGIPKKISFDHDLAPSHYTPSHLWNDYNKSKEWQNKQKHTEITGAGCAIWLRWYCEENNLELPIWYCHSANPVGRDKIIKFLS